MKVRKMVARSLNGGFEFRLRHSVLGFLPPPRSNWGRDFSVGDAVNIARVGITEYDIRPWEKPRKVATTMNMATSGG